MYRRRRLAVLLCASALLATGYSGWAGLHRHGAGASGGGPLTAAGQPARFSGATVVHATLAVETRIIVQPGDTLWSIARRVQPTGDIRPLVAGMDASRHGRPLQVGENIVITHTP